MQLRESEQEFIYHFGEMGSRWGINRTVGQMYALLVLSQESLFADQIAEALSISRGNVSMGMKELQAWGLVHIQHKPGDRTQRICDNVQRGHAWNHSQELADIAQNLTSQGDDLARFGLHDVHTINADRSPLGQVIPIDHPHKGRLTRTRGPGQRHALPWRHVKGHIADNFNHGAALIVQREGF